MLRPCQTPDAECDVIVEQESYRSLGVPGGSMSAAHEALVRQAIEVIWNRGDLDAADELFAPTT
jgi:hypothetical protein